MPKTVYLVVSFLSILLVTSLVHSNTGTVTIAVEQNPKSIAINPNTDIAVVPNEKSDSISIVDLNMEKVIATVPVGKANPSFDSPLIKGEDFLQFPPIKGGLRGV